LFKRKFMGRVGAVTVMSLMVLLLAIGCAGNHAGMKAPQTLTDAEKAEAIAIAFQAPQIASLIEKGSPYTVSLGWMAIVWSGSEVGGYRSFGEDVLNDPNFPMVPAGSLWYPEVIIATGTEIITQAQIAVDLGTKRVVYVDGPYPSLSSPGRFPNTPTP
jgi:hypothetical protein